jgi:hypothetical protein
VSEQAGFVAVDEITDEYGEPALRHVLTLQGPSSPG